jgi:beta-glucanase (GH16 family)
MRCGHASIAAALLFASPLRAAPPAPAFNPDNPAASGYTITFSDNFNALNGAVWELDWWYNISSETPCQQAYLPGTALVSGSGLRMHIQSLEAVPACVGGTQIYSAAHLDAYQGIAQKLGYYEASIQSSATGGTLTAFWLLPASGAWPPELDIEEIRGDYPAMAYLTNHTGAANTQKQFVYVAPASLGGAYHVYGALLTSSHIIWYIDGIKRGQTSRGPGELAPLFPIFSLYTGACGDGWAGCPSKTTAWSADANVQWIRVWRAKAGLRRF